MSDANRTAVGLCEEALLGTTPANPVFESLRVTGANLAYAKQTVTSKELRPDRQVTDLITTGFQAGGDLPMEASYGALDSQIRGAFMSDWTLASIRQNTATETANISAVSATAYTVAAGVTGDQYKVGAFAQYMLVAASGFGDAGNNRTVVAGAASSGTSVVITGGTVDAAPAVGARLKCIGFQGPSGDLVAVAGGLGSQGLTSTTLDFTTLNLVAGEWVYVGGPSAGTAFATAGVRGFCRVLSVAAHSLLFDVVPSTWAVDAGTGKTVQVYVGDYIRNGVTRRSYTIELQYQDLAVPEYEYYTGMVPSDLALTVQAQAILTAKLTYMGLNASDVTARAAGASDTAAPTGDVMTGSSNVGFLYENGAPVAGPNFVLGANISLANNLRRNMALGSLGSVNIGIGQALVSGDLNMYYGNNTILQKIRNSTASGYALGLIDNTGTKAMLFDIPRIKFSDGNPTVPGIDTDRMLDGKFDGMRHPTLGYTIQFQRFEAINV